nr:star lipid transfer protein 7 [Hymenolepis microstoma]
MLVSRGEFIRRKLFDSLYSRLRLKQSDIGKLRLLARVIHRAFLANILTLRESAGLMIRRIGDLYRAGYFNFSQDITINRSQKVLLGACLISFAQDSISEDEMIATVEAFDVEKYNKLYFSPSGFKEENVEFACEPDFPPPRVYSSLESPLTFYIRDLRHTFRTREIKFLRDIIFRAHPSDSSPSNTESAVASSFTPPTSPRGVMLTELSKRLSTDGKGFIDAGWELIIDRPELRMWRRPSSRLSGISSGLYEYRVCGSFTDISARCFLEVQLNLEYRRQWDNSVVALESSRSTNQTADAAETEVIRWVARFPFPMARREYIYARRWWLTTSALTPTHEGLIALIISRACNRMSKNEGNGENSTKGSDGSHSCSVEAQSEGGMVSVKAYESNIFIRSHGNIDEPGLDYFLVYYDDPELILSAEAASRISSTVVPKLLERLHDAALTISKQGLPEYISPIVPSCQFPFSQDAKVPPNLLSSDRRDETVNTSHSSNNSTSISFYNKVYRRFFGS